MLRNYFLAVVLLALAGCGGDSGPAQTADGYPKPQFADR